MMRVFVVVHHRVKNQIQNNNNTTTKTPQVFSLYQKQRDDANTRNVAKCALFVRIINSKTRERTGDLLLYLTKGMENFTKKWIFSQKVFILSSDSLRLFRQERDLELNTNTDNTERRRRRMDFLPHALQQKVRKGVYALKGLSECEQLVLESTDKEKWGPHGEQLKSLAEKTVAEEEGVRGRGGNNNNNNNNEESDTRIILRVLFENRLKKRDLEWRLCYKALTVIDYLIANGSETIVREIQRRIGRDLQPLKTFEHRDPEKGRDEGINIRQKVTNMIALLEDPERVREVREKARMNRGKYSGMSNADLKASSRNRNSANDTYNNRATYNNNDSATRVATPTTTSAIISPSATTPAPKSKNDGAHSGTSAMSNVLNAFEDDKDDDEDDDDGDNDEFMTGGGNQRSKGSPTFVPKVVIRDTPIQRPPNSAGFSATLKPPPRGGNAFVKANNTNLFFENRPASNTQKPTTASPTISLDELLGGGSGGGGGGGATNTNQSSSTGTPYQSAEDLFGFEANVSKPTPQQPTTRAPLTPAPAAAIDDLFFGMETTPTAPIAQPAVMPKQQHVDPFSDFAASTPSKINFSSNNNSNNRNKKPDPLDALDFGSLGLK